LHRNVASSSAVETDIASGGVMVAPDTGRFLTRFVACPTCRLKAAMTDHTKYQCGGCGRGFTSHEGVRTYAELAG
jgi:DNA-directed RNA polymerase subunit RPC12/RpoP